MANTKISALSSASTPLSGSEIVPINQSGVTDSVSVTNLTAGRAVSAASLSLTTTPLAVSSGGTGLATLGSGYIPYGNGTSAYSYSSNFYYDGSNLFALGTGGVNIGTSTGAGKLTVLASASSNIFSFDAPTAGYSYGAFKYNGTAYGYIGQSSALIVFASNTDFAIRYANNLNFASGGTLVWTLNSSGSFVQAISGQGINFTANTPASGMTSQNLTWYEEGTWTPSDQSGAGLTFTSSSGKYTRIGNMVMATGFVQYPATVNASQAIIGGLPWNSVNSTSSGNVIIGYKSAATLNSMFVVQSNNTMKLWNSSGSATTNAGVASTQIYFTAIYPVS